MPQARPCSDGLEGQTHPDQGSLPPRNHPELSLTPRGESSEAPKRSYESQLRRDPTALEAKAVRRPLLPMASCGPFLDLPSHIVLPQFKRNQETGDGPKESKKHD